MAECRTVRQVSSAKPGSSAPEVDRPVAFGTGLIALDVILGGASVTPTLAAGGTCGNVLTALSYLGWSAYPVARLNGDPASELLCEDLRRWDVALDFASRAPTAATPIIVQIIRRDRHGAPRHRFSLVCPACGTWFPSFRPVTRVAALEVIDEIEPRWRSGSRPRVFFFDRVSRGALLLAEEFAARGGLVVFEPSGVGNPRLFAEALRVAHVLKYSHERLPDLAAGGPTDRACLLEIETRGAEGLHYRSRLLRSRSWCRLAAIRPPEIVDTAGAGDWCMAGILHRLASAGLGGLTDARPGDLRDALRFGQAIAALGCVHEGARGVMYRLSRLTFQRGVAAVAAAEPVPEEVFARTASEVPEKPWRAFTPPSAGEGTSLGADSAQSPIRTICPACS